MFSSSIEVNQNADFSANYQKDWRWRLAVLVYLVLLPSQLKYQCKPQLWAFTFPASLVNKNKLT